MVTSKNGKRAASAGFAGEVRVWSVESGSWAEEGKLVGARFLSVVRPHSKAVAKMGNTRGYYSRRDMGDCAFSRWTIFSQHYLQWTD